MKKLTGILALMMLACFSSVALAVDAAATTPSTGSATADKPIKKERPKKYGTGMRKTAKKPAKTQN